MINKIIAKTITKSIPKNPSLNVFARKIVSKGNGQRRTIVKGFGGVNLDETNHFNKIDNFNFWNIRPVVTGFSNEGRPLVKKISLPQNKANIRFFPNYKSLRISRHFVYDIPTQRVQVKGFGGNTETVTGSIPTKPVKLPTRDEILAQERVVVQGFGGDSTKPIYKKMDNSNSTPRTVVKGFLG